MLGAMTAVMAIPIASANPLVPREVCEEALAGLERGWQRLRLSLHGLALRWGELDTRELERMARGGNADAQGELAWRLAHGPAESRDGEAAMTWAKKSAAGGSAVGWATLGWLRLSEGKDEMEAVLALRRAAEGGEPRGRTGLALCVLFGKGVAADPAAGRRLLEDAAASGDGFAAYWLGRCAYEGRFGERDDALAANWLRRAAASVPAAADLYGRCLYFGRGVASDCVAARAHWRKAAEAGVASACFALGLCLLHGVGGEADVGQAVRWLRQAARHGIAPAMFALGHCLLLGLGCRKDPVAATAWIRRAADSGFAPAMTWLEESASCQRS